MGGNAYADEEENGKADEEVTQVAPPAAEPQKAETENPSKEGE